MSDNIERLRLETKAQANTVRSKLLSRQDHPTYGVTKKAIAADFNKLLGMCEAYLYATGMWQHAGKVVWDADTRQLVLLHLGVDVQILSNLVNK